MARTATVTRTTKETDITVTIDLDGTGAVDAHTGLGFFDHMLDAFGRHGMFDLTVRAEGDLHVDGHHTVEDTGIVLGQAIASALGDKRGIARFGSQLLPMDEALMLCALDISGRGALYWDVELPFGMVGDFDTQLAREFFIALAANAGLTLHLREIAGDNAHHVIEAAFKACGRALRAACEKDERVGNALPSTKGAL
ncbi:MAG: imidazoleglycerol-phosphate dehydratase HisB [Eggerthellaceae bacterium]|nr:imidazoleglycerol-phosphate dehydratase HisB [Eggerthellaceae bacterium]